MPNRILRQGILTSPRIAKLGWPEEVFYRRLHSVVDDFGRYYADSGLLRAACYPRQLNKVSDPDIGKWLRACVDAALVRVYPAQDGESYLEVLDFGQQVRAKKSTFPDPLSACVADAKQTPANAHLDVSVSGVVSEDSVAKATGADAPVGKSEDQEKRELFDAGKSLLAEQGMNAKQTGSFIGKLAKDYGQPAALEAVRSAVVNRPMGAAEYLLATCQRLEGERRDPVTVPSDAAERTAAALAQQAAHTPEPPADAIRERLNNAKAAAALAGIAIRVAAA